MGEVTEKLGKNKPFAFMIFLERKRENLRTGAKKF